MISLSGGDAVETNDPVSAIDALIAHLAIEHDLVLLTTDRDFEHIARHAPLTLWASTG